MRIIFSRPVQLHTWCEDQLHDGRHVLFDGLPGAGKSHYARKIAASLGVPHIEVDKLVKARQLQLSNRYPTYAALANLAMVDIDLTQPSFLDGIEALDWATTAVRQPFAHLYIKKLTRHGLWLHSRMLGTAYDEHIPPNALHLSIRSYHERRTPLEVCDGVLEWTEI